MTISRQEALSVLTEGHEALNQKIAGVPESERGAPGSAGSDEWSMVDLRGHVSTWEELALDTLRQWIAGKIPDAWERIEAAGGVDGFNAAELERKRSLPSSDVTARAEEVHSSLVTEMRALTDEHWTSEPFWETDMKITLGEALGRLTGGQARGAFSHAFDHLEGQAASA